MSYFSSQFAPRTVALSLCLFAANASAQAAHDHTAVVAATSNATAPSSSAVSQLRYESVFARYKSYRDEKTGSWREANDTVDRVGGWRAYAKEAQQPDAAAPAKPDPHAGHGAKP